MNFRYDFRFLCMGIQTLLMQRIALWRPAYRVRNCITMKKSRFFKVADTFTMMWTRKKKHLTKVSSGLKTIYDHLRRSWDNLKNWFRCVVKITSCSILVRNAAGRDFHSATKSIFSNYIRNVIISHKWFLAPNWT